MLRLPFLVGHAIDDLPRFGIAELHAPFLGGGAIPLREAVAAEAGKIHQVDVLNIGALPQMLHEAAEGGGFEVGAGLVVHGGLQILLSLYVAPAAAFARGAAVSPVTVCSIRQSSTCFSAY